MGAVDDTSAWITQKILKIGKGKSQSIGQKSWTDWDGPFTRKNELQNEGLTKWSTSKTEGRQWILEKRSLKNIGMLLKETEW